MSMGLYNGKQGIRAQKNSDNNGLSRNGLVFDSRWEQCKNRASRPSQGTVNGGAVITLPLRHASSTQLIREKSVWVCY